MDSGSKLHAVPWMIRVLGGRLWMVVALAGLEVVIAGGAVYTAWVMRDLVNAAVGGASDALRLSVVVFAAVSVALIALQALYRFLQERARTMFQNILRLRFLDKVLHAELSSVQAVHTGEWMSRLTDDARIVASGVTTVLPSAAGMLAQLVGSLALLVVMVPQIAWMLIPAGIVFAGFTLGFRRVLKRLHKRIRETDGRARSHLIECLNSLLVVKSFQREDFAERGAAALLEDHRAACMRRNRFSNLCNIGFGLAMRGAYLVAAAYCAYGILEGSVSYGTFVAALQLVGQVQGPLANISGCVPRYFAMTASAERLMDAEALPHDGVADSEEGPAADTTGFAGLELRGASCRYGSEAPNAAASSGPRTIRCPDMNIRRGEFVAFTGPSGCGKSTTLKAMMAFCPCETGECCVLLGDGSRKPLTVRWRSLFSYVPHGNHLMGGTVREAVAFGDTEGASCDLRMWDALRIACADFVREMPKGLDSQLGESGGGLSEGQVQRLAIARAVFSNRPVLLLDEATCSLDPDTERRVLQNLSALPDKTVVAVTHRPAALEVCDKRVEFSE